jgi:mannitol-1-/sugar-/sorbitol-6-/2-deoxyglucose-6-phosphatase
MIDAVIFDMDGLLIDSEPYWQDAELEVLGGLGLPITREDTIKTMGLRVDEITAQWYLRQPWRGPSPEAVAEQILDVVVERVRREGFAKDGVGSVVELVRARGVKVGLATSSAERLIDAVVDRLGLGGVFQVRISAQFEKYGKPHPAVYLRTCEALGVAPIASLAFEDSLNGVLAAKSARMRCVAVPAADMREDPRFSIADRVLPSLTEMTPAIWDAIA